MKIIISNTQCAVDQTEMLHLTIASALSAEACSADQAGISTTNVSKSKMYGMVW